MEINIKAPQITTSFKTEKIYPQLEELNVTPGTENQEFVSSKDGFSSVIVAGDGNLLAENIKSGVTLFNVEGINADTADADATSNDIRLNKVAYAKNLKIVGTMPDYNAQINIGGTTSLTTEKNLLTSTIEKVDLTNVDTSGLKSWDYAFWNCSNLKELIGFKAGNATSMYWVFYMCGFTETPEMDTSGVKNMSRLFQSNTSLITVKEFDTSKVTDMTYMFQSCSALENLCVLNTSNVTSMNNFVSGCTNLTDESLNNILQMCINATKLKSKAVSYRRLSSMGLTQEQATRCQLLSNYETFIAAGFTTGY